LFKYSTKVSMDAFSDAAKKEEIKYSQEGNYSIKIV
jgi:hypothetical protein